MDSSKNTYEGMFVLPAGTGGFEAACEPIRQVLARSEAEILSLKPWDERKMAYDIAGQSRALYALSYFSASPDAITEIEHDCQLNESILRVLILHREQLSDDLVNADTPATARAAKAKLDAAAKAEAEAAALAEAAAAPAPEAEATTEAVAEETPATKVEAEAEAPAVEAEAVAQEAPAEAEAVDDDKKAPAGD